MSLFSPPPTYFPDSPYNLRKRKVEIEDLDERPPDSPLTKRFRHLAIRTPPSSSSTSSKPTRRSTSTTTRIQQPWNKTLTPPPFQRPPSPPPAAMDVDDTPYRIYVNDLDSASSSSASDDDEAHDQTENPVIFLSDVEREMSRIPLAVLKASTSTSSSSSPIVPTVLPTARSSTGSSTDLILYRPPEELVDDSSVRRMIQQAKARIRMRSADGVDASGSVGIVPPVVDVSMAVDGMGFTRSPESYIPAAMPDSDPDAMVLDDL
ncbi:hypothetical protein TWF696_002825 [Orbilia brochopaga]|uniref:Uncharacterized protein n=1 Tax=Orbilia brochopaga TaxID=3140254 RepID=A0AAV9U0L6_9PEZI